MKANCHPNMFCALAHILVRYGMSINGPSGLAEAFRVELVNDEASLKHYTSIATDLGPNHAKLLNDIARLGPNVGMYCVDGAFGRTYGFICIRSDMDGVTTECISLI